MLWAVHYDVCKYQYKEEMACVSVILSREAIIGPTISFNYDLNPVLLKYVWRARTMGEQQQHQKRQQPKNSYLAIVSTLTY